MIVRVLEVDRRSCVAEAPAWCSRRGGVLLAGVLALWTAVPASAQPGQAGLSPAGSLQVEPSTQRESAVAGLPTADDTVGVIVRLKLPSVLGHLAALPGRGTGRGPGLQGLEARQHAARVDAQQRAFEGQVGTVVPGLRVTHRYAMSMNALALRVPRSAMSRLARLEGVAAVYPDSRRELLTTRSPELIGATALWNGAAGSLSTGENVVIGTIDSGIWPEHPSFADPAPSGPYAPLAGWGGRPCQFGSGAAGDAAFACNNKLLTARRLMATYDATVGLQPGEFASARDESGHGSLVASIAAGNAAVTATYLGNGLGVASGVAPRARLAVYKVCGRSGCYDSDAIAAVQQAILDGVQVLHLPLTGGADPYADPLSLALLDAYNAGIFVAGAAGNGGMGDVGGRHEPWVTTVGATTLDRYYLSALTLRSGTRSLVIYGSSITPGVTTATAVVNASSVGDPYCTAGAPAGTFAGKVVICARGGNGRIEKSRNVALRGAVGMILVNTATAGTSTDNFFVPTIHLEKSGADSLLAFMANPSVTATFTAGTRVAVAGDTMASFTSRGAAGQPLGISKPDVVAPGVQIVGGHSGQPASVDGGPAGQPFQAIDGTSLASAHVAGAAALLKALNPAWTPDHIKSALMLTATTAVKKETGAAGDAFDYGSGRIRVDVAARPGLAILPAPGEMVAKRAALWDVNYPSIYASTMPGLVTTRRVLQNLEARSVTWNVSATATSGLSITVPTSVTLPALGTATMSISLEAATMAIDGVGAGTITLTEVGGTRTLRVAVTMLRRANAIPLSTTCSATTVRVGQTVDCAIDVANTDTAPASLTVFDTLPAGLRVVPGSVVNGLQSGQTVYLQGVLPAADPAGIDLRPWPPYGGYVSLAGYYAPITCSGSCDDRTFVASVPQGIRFNGVVHRSVSISSNGFMQLGSSEAGTSPNNQNLPDAATPNAVLAPFWTDLHPAGTDGQGQGQMYAGYLTWPSGRTWLVVEWTNVVTKGTTQKHSFQVWLQLGGQVEDVTYSYLSLDSLGSNGRLTVGAENVAGTAGETRFFDGTGIAPLAASNLLVSSSAPVPGGAVRLTFRATALTAGAQTHCAIAVRDGSGEVPVSCATITVTP